ncbi:MAG TPA: hypothetical protein VF699_09820 [Caulobacteraceae bacterium]|jgi:hypothetical protein
MRALPVTLLLCTLAACGGGEEAPALAGAPCPTLTAEAFQQRGVTLKNNSAFNDLAVRRQFGGANCTGTTSGNNSGKGGSCELSSPGVTHVTVGGRDTYFDIPVGEPATIQVSGGEVRCVLTREQKQ